MLLKMEDIQKELRVSRKNVYELIRSGGLDRYISRVGGHYRLTAERLKQFIDDAVVTKD